MSLEIWEAISEGEGRYFFIIDTITYSVYTRDYRAGLWFFENRGEAEKELKKIKQSCVVGCWLGG